MIDQLAVSSWADADVEALHRRCGVYTRNSVVCTLLDSVGWTSSSDLVGKRLLEPAAGDGAFVVEAASRLLDSMSRRGIRPNPSLLAEQIYAFEIHAGEAMRARARISEILIAHGLTSIDAECVSQSWIRNSDFLTADLPERRFTHVVGNPPYSRWSKISEAMRVRYEQVLPRRMTHGDIFLPFLDLGIGCLEHGGRLGFVCTDRWRYMAFAEGFRRTRLPEVAIERDEPINAIDAYDRRVDTYPSLLVMRRTRMNEESCDGATKDRGLTLAEAGYQVRVGPALGVTAAFVLEPGEDGVEEELLAPWARARDVRDGEITSSGRRVIALYDDHGKLRDLNDYPQARDRFETFRPMLEARSIVRNGAVWYRPIDRVVAADWCRPKLLVPELAKEARVALDISGSIPSHGIYAIFAPGNDLEDLHERLRDGGLRDRLQMVTPKVKGKYLRCYKRFLDKLLLEVS